VAPKKAIVKKDLKSQGGSQEMACDGRANFLIATIQVNLVPNHGGEGSPNSPELFLLKFFAISLPS